MGHCAGRGGGCGVHEGVSGVVTQSGKGPGGIADVLGHASGQIRQQLQGSCRQEGLTWHIRQLGIRPVHNRNRHITQRLICPAETPNLLMQPDW